MIHIIISCSKDKNRLKNSPAYLVYNGPIFKLLRKNLLENSRFKITIFSAKYGIIDWNSKISYYDKLLSDVPNITFVNNSNIKLAGMLNNTSYSKIYICMGKKYYSFLCQTLDDHKHEFIEGKIGIKLSKLKKILYQEVNQK